MPGNPLSDPNWAPDLTDKIVNIIGKVRDNTTDRAVVGVRAVVFGLLAVVAAITALPLLLVVLTRLFQQLVQLVPGVDYGRSVWLSYVVVGLLMIGAGFLAMSKRFAGSGGNA
jgi:hypothetical protein